MKGFSGIITGGASPRLVRSYATYNDKFPDDKVNSAGEDYDLMLDGVVLNAADLLARYGVDSVTALLPVLWEARGEAMTEELKGSFVLCLWDRRRDTVFVANDRLSKRPLYYYQSGERTFFSSRYLALVSLLAEEGIRPDWSPAAFAMMAATGYLYDRCTYLRGLYCLRPYEALLSRGGVTARIGAEPAFAESHEPESALQARFTALFREAVRLQYQKDEEAGYRQVASLSGGMDSRSTVLMGEKLGWRLSLGFCYAQPGSVDEGIARKLARRLDAPFLFYPMDRAEFLFRPEEHARRNEGEMSYCGSTGAATVSALMDTTCTGILHTGLMGGEVLTGICFAGDPQAPVNPFSGEAGEEYALSLPCFFSQGHHILRRLLRASLNFTRMFQDVAEPLSPFMDEDVYAFCQTIPCGLRRGRAFYIRWMRRELPNGLVTTYCRGPVGTPLLLQRVLRYADEFLERRLGKTVFSMNPWAYWFRDVPGLPEAVRGFTERYGAVSLPESLRAPLLLAGRRGDGLHSLYALSALLAAWLTEEAGGNRA